MGPKTTHDANGALWDVDVIWECYKAFQEKGGDIKLLKVASHAVEKGIVQEPILTHGNELADQHAREGCKEHQVDDGFLMAIDRYDTRAHIIMRRLLTITSVYLRRDGHFPAGPIYGPKRPSPLDEQISSLGHEIVSKGKAGYLCTLCGDKWTKNTRNALISTGQCRGEYPWDPPLSTLRTWKLPRV